MDSGFRRNEGGDVIYVFPNLIGPDPNQFKKGLSGMQFLNWLQILASGSLFTQSPGPLVPQPLTSFIYWFYQFFYPLLRSLGRQWC